MMQAMPSDPLCNGALAAQERRDSKTDLEWSRCLKRSMAEVAVVSQGDAEHADCAPNAKVDCCIGKAEDIVPQVAKNNQKDDDARSINPELMPGNHFGHCCHGFGWMDDAPQPFGFACSGFHIRSNAFRFLGLRSGLIAFL